jgi:hypothetical protein
MFQGAQLGVGAARVRARERGSTQD